MSLAIVAALRAQGASVYLIKLPVDLLVGFAGKTALVAALCRALGAELPKFAHVPMILGSDGERLSKRHGAVNILEYRDAGFLPEAMVNYLARLGWSHGNQEIFTRDELIEQAAAKIEAEIGAPVGMELGKRRDATRPQLELEKGLVIVSSTQTMGRRYQDVPADFFDLVILDEAHHALGEMNRKIFGHFARAKRFGVTATPDRGDKKGLIELFDNVAHEMQLLEAIQLGWLVPIRFHQVDIPELDLSSVSRRAGDFVRSDLSEIMETLAVLRKASVEIVNRMGRRPTLVFCVSVKHAHLQAESLREVLADHGLGHIQVAALDGSSDRDERKRVVQAFRDGEIQILCGCDLFTEGFDAPATALVAILRPTLSRPLHCQMVGRGTRPLPGVVDGPPTAAERRAAIAASGKPDMLLLDFVGNSGRHELVNAIDLLGEDVTADEVREVKALLETGDIDDLLSALEQVRERRRAAERARLAREGDFFALFGYVRKYDVMERAMTEAQARSLAARDIQTPALDFTSANQILLLCDRRRDDRLCTYKQARLLARLHVPLGKLEALDVRTATEMLNYAHAHQWKPPKDPPWWRAFVEPEGQHNES